MELAYASLAPTVRAADEHRGTTPLTAAPRPPGCVRPQRRSGARSFPRRTGGPDLALRGCRRASVARRRRRRAMAGRGLGTDSRVRGAPASGGACCAVVRLARRGTRSRWVLPELEVLGLSDGDARALLGSAVPFRLDDRVRDRIVAETRGNPLALLELPRGLTVTQLAGGFGLLDAPRQALASRLEESFQRRLEALPAVTGSCCWSPPPSRSATRARPACGRATRGRDRRGGRADGWAARDRRDGEVPSSARPLCRVRICIGRAAPSGASGAGRVDRSRARPRPPGVASRSGNARPGRERGASSWSDPPVALRPAVGSPPRRPSSSVRPALTADPARRAERALAAAQASLQAGAFDAVLDLAGHGRGRAARRVPARPGGTPARPGRLRLGLHQRYSPAAVEGREATRGVRPGARARDLPGRLGRGGHRRAPRRTEILLEICRSAQALPASTERSASPRPSARRRHARDHRRTRRRDSDVAASSASARRDPSRGRAALGHDGPGRQRARVGLRGHARDLGNAGPARSRRRCARTRCRSSSSMLGLARAWMGDFAGAASAEAEAESVAAATGYRIAPYTLLRLRALQGREAEAAAPIASAIEHAEPQGQGLAAIYAQWAAAVLYNGLAPLRRGGVRGPTSHVRRPSSPGTPCGRCPSSSRRPRARETELARDALERLAETTQPAGNDFALGIEARCRALLSDGAAAERPLPRGDRAVGPHPAASGARPRALLYGEWLRREGRRVDAREQLRTAHDMFAAIGMEAFAERARRELIATGEKVRKRDAETRDELTPQERADRPARPRRPHQPGDRRPSCSSAPAPSSGISARCSPSSGSTRAGRFPTPCRSARPNPHSRSGNVGEFPAAGDDRLLHRRERRPWVGRSRRRR